MPRPLFALGIIPPLLLMHTHTRKDKQRSGTTTTTGSTQLEPGGCGACGITDLNAQTRCIGESLVPGERICTYRRVATRMRPTTHTTYYI